MGRTTAHGKDTTPASGTEMGTDRAVHTLWHGPPGKVGAPATPGARWGLRLLRWFLNIGLDHFLGVCAAERQGLVGAMGLVLENGPPHGVRWCRATAAVTVGPEGRAQAEVRGNRINTGSKRMIRGGQAQEEGVRVLLSKIKHPNEDSPRTFIH